MPMNEDIWRNWKGWKSCAFPGLVRRMLAEELENQCAAFLVAEDGVSGKVLGYAGLLVMADEGYITNVAVFPEYRRSGVAAKLIEVFENFARGNRLAFLTLEVRPPMQRPLPCTDASAFRKWGGGKIITTCRKRTPDSDTVF